MLLSGIRSPLLNVYGKASLPHMIVCPASAGADDLAQLLSNAAEPLIFICANIREAVSFFEAVSPAKFFGSFRAKKTLVFADASKPFWQTFAQSLLPYVDAYATADCVQTPLDPKKWVPNIYMPIRDRDWALASQTKPIDVGFYGSVEMFSERRETIRYLLNANVNLSVAGGNESAYAINFMEALRDTKITLNFSNCNTGEGPPIHHVKGRLWEAAVSRTVIIETRNPVTPQLFSSEEIIWYDQKEALPELIRELLADDVRRNAIADRMYQKAMEYIQPELFWAKFE